MAIDFFNKGSDLQGQFNSLFKSDSKNNDLYNFMGEKYGLEEDGTLALSSEFGNKPDINKLMSGVRDYFGQDKQEGFTDQMMSSPAFMMGLSLMKQASEGKNIGGALMPAAEATQGFITNQELRKNNQRLMKMKEGQFFIETLESQQDMESKDLKNVMQDFTNKDFKWDFDKKVKYKESRDNYIDKMSYLSPEYKELIKTDDSGAALNQAISGNADVINNTNHKLLYENNKSKGGLGFLQGIGIKDKERAEAEVFIEEQVIHIAYSNAASQNRDMNARDIIEAERLVLEQGGIQENSRFWTWVNGRDYSINVDNIENVIGAGTTSNFLNSMSSDNKLKGPPDPFRAKGGEVNENQAYIVGEEGPEVFVPQQNGAIISNPKTAGGYTWEDAIIDSSEMLKKIKQSSGAEEAKKALKKFRPDLYI